MIRHKRGVIVRIALDPTQGQEIQKTRPCVVVSKGPAHKSDMLAWVVPLTSYSEKKARRNGHVAVARTSGGNNLDKDSVAVCPQLRCVDLHARFRGYIGIIDDEALDSILSELQGMLKRED